MDEANEYLIRFREGDPAAMGELMELYRRPLYAFIVSMRPKDDAEDVFQEVWLKAIRNIDRFKANRFLSWLFRIAHNHVIDRSRKRGPEHSLQEIVADGGSGTLERQDLVRAVVHDPAALAGHAELAERIAKAVANLPDEQREAFLMRTEGGLSFKEISAIQETPVNTALARMQYALGKLREALREDYENL